MTNLILPENLCKYVGTITEILNTNSETRYQLRIRRTGVLNICKVFKTRKEAIDYMKQINLEKALVKNLIYDCGDYYEVDLTQGQRTKFDKDNLELIENFTWYATRNRKTFYVQTNDLNSRKTLLLHKLILESNDSKLTVDHINRDGLDNRKVNLRLVDKRTQIINQSLSSRNTTGYVGVYKDRNYWRACYYDESGKQITKSFSTKEYGCDSLAKIEAIKWRQQKEKEIEHYKKALNHETQENDYSDLIDDLE